MTTILFLLLAATSPESEAAFEEAKEKYQSMDVEGAQRAFSELADAETDPSAKAQILVWLGLTQAELGAFDDSDTTFRAAFENDLDSTLPPDVSPKIAERFDALKVEAQAAADAQGDTDGDADSADGSDASGLGFDTILLGTGVAFLAGTVVFGLIAGGAWVGAVALYQSAVSTPDAKGASGTYFTAQVLAWSGNACMGLALVALLAGSATTGGWAVLATLE